MSSGFAGASTDSGPPRVTARALSPSPSIGTHGQRTLDADAEELHALCYL